jgi:hypothetical protein
MSTEMSTDYECLCYKGSLNMSNPHLLILTLEYDLFTYMNDIIRHYMILKYHAKHLVQSRN